MISGRDELLPTTVTGLQWLTPKTFELRFQKPSHFNFRAGQKVSLAHGDIYRDYSLINAPEDKDLAVCIRLVAQGVLSPVLSRTRPGDVLHMSPAFGQFLFQSDTRSPVLVATGTGVAPFVAYARSGVGGFRLLHGVGTADELYYCNELAACADAHIACIPGVDEAKAPGRFSGRVTDYLSNRLATDAYDFYLCGRREMIRDAMRIIDRRFPDARVFTEIFF